MLYEKKTAAGAVKHFEQNGYKDVLQELRRSDKKEYDRVRKIVNDASRGNVSYIRVKALLEKYAAGVYQFTEVIHCPVFELNEALNDQP